MSFDSYVPRLCLFITIVSYALMGNPISAQSVYIITAYYNNMRYSVNICLEFSKDSIIISKYIISQSPPKKKKFRIFYGFPLFLFQFLVHCLNKSKLFRELDRVETRKSYDSFLLIDQKVRKLFEQLLFQIFICLNNLFFSEYHYLIIFVSFRDLINEYKSRVLFRKALTSYFF